MSKKKKTAWRQRQEKDLYVRKARAKGLRSRAAFKLSQVNDQYQLIRSGDVVVELGSAPGGWSQLVSRWVGPHGQVLALDLLPMNPIPGVEFIQGDFTDPLIYETLVRQLRGPCHVVVSDMAPNLTGQAVCDQAACERLWLMVLEFCEHQLVSGGSLVLKMFHGSAFNDIVLRIRSKFANVSMFKPDASRAKSREVFAIAKNFQKKHTAD